MFQEWFASMHEMLDEIVVQYPHANKEHRQELDEQMNMLQELSMDCCEEWLVFEEKLAQWKEALCTGNVSAHEEVHPITLTDEFQKGEGYFTLLMFPEANRYFQQVVDQHPDFYMGRVYLGIGMLETGQLDEAYRQLSFVVSLVNDVRVKAIALHGMGCIQVQKNHLEKACEYFRMARDTDPSLSYYSLS